MLHVLLASNKICPGKFVTRGYTTKSLSTFLIATDSSCFLADGRAVKTCCFGEGFVPWIDRVKLIWWLVPEALLGAVVAFTNGLVLVCVTI